MSDVIVLGNEDWMSQFDAAETLDVTVSRVGTLLATRLNGSGLGGNRRR